MQTNRRKDEQTDISWHSITSIQTGGQTDKITNGLMHDVTDKIQIHGQTYGPKDKQTDRHKFL